MIKHTGIAVVETRWWAKSNISVRGLFDLVADLHCGNPHAYHYEMINSEASAKGAIPRIGRLKHCRYLYIAAHGDDKGICFEGTERLTRTELRNALKSIKGSSFTGLYLGSCTFGTENLADWLFKENVQLKWVAGYSKTVNWLESSSLDLLVFNELLRKPRKGTTPGTHLANTTARISDLASGLANKLGFGFYVP